MDQLNLRHYQQFKEILRNYKMSDQAKSALEGLSFVLLVAPTSTGRNTVIRHLVNTKDYYFIVSDTTRPPQFRDGKMEVNGVDYFFRTEEEMLSELIAGEFLEAALIHEQQVSGISVRELMRAKALVKTAITDIEIVGADKVMSSTNMAKAVFLIPPSFEEWQHRLSRRGHMSQHELRNRLMSAEKEFRAAIQNHYYHFVITEDIKQSASIIDSICKGGQNPHQDRGAELIHTISHQLREKLMTIDQ